MELHLKIIQIHTELATTIIVKPPARQHFPLLFRRKTSVGASSCPKYWRLTLNCGTLLTGIAHTSFFCAVFHRTYFCDPGSERGHYQFNGPINRAWRIQFLALKTIRLVFAYWAKSSGILLDDTDVKHLKQRLNAKLFILDIGIYYLYSSDT